LIAISHKLAELKTSWLFKSAIRPCALTLNLSRTLKLMARYGIVKIEEQRRTIKPIVEATDFKVQFGLNTSSRLEYGSGNLLHDRS